MYDDAQVIQYFQSAPLRRNVHATVTNHNSNLEVVAPLGNVYAALSVNNEYLDAVFRVAHALQHGTQRDVATLPHYIQSLQRPENIRDLVTVLDDVRALRYVSNLRRHVEWQEEQAEHQQYVDVNPSSYNLYSASPSPSSEQHSHSSRSPRPARSPQRSRPQSSPQSPKQSWKEWLSSSRR